MSATGSGSPAPNLRAKVRECMHRMTRAPLLSAACRRLLEISRLPAEDVDLAELDRIVSHEPSMASRLLRVANSPHYCSHGTISTVRQAMIVIGLTDLMSLLLVTSLMEGFSQDMAMTFLNPTDFWAHCVAVGSASRACALHWGSDMLSLPEMNLAGLVHDIGKSVFIRNFPHEMDLCIRRVTDEGCGLLDAEAETFGLDHAELGGMLASEWNLPEFVVQAARYHHAPAQAGEAYVRIVRIVTWCNELALAEGIGASGDVARPTAAVFPGEAEPLEAKLASRRTEVLQAAFQDLQLVSAKPGAIPPEEAQPNLLGTAAPLGNGATQAEPLRSDPKPESQPHGGVWARIVGFFSRRPQKPRR